MKNYKVLAKRDQYGWVRNDGIRRTKVINDNAKVITKMPSRLKLEGIFLFIYSA